MMIDTSQPIALPTLSVGPLERHDDAVLTAGDDHLRRQGRGDTRDGRNVLPDPQNSLAFHQVPNDDAQIFRAADHVSAVGRDVDATHAAAVTFVHGNAASVGS